MNKYANSFMEILLSSIENDHKTLNNFIDSSKNALTLSIITVHSLKNSELPTERILELLRLNLMSLEKMLSKVSEIRDIQLSNSYNDVINQDIINLIDLFTLELESMSYFSKRLIDTYNYHENQVISSKIKSDIYSLFIQRQSIFTSILNLRNRLEYINSEDVHKNTLNKLFFLTRIISCQTHSPNRPEKKYLELLYPTYCLSAIGSTFFSSKTFKESIIILSQDVDYLFLIPFLNLSHLFKNINYLVSNSFLVKEIVDDLKIIENLIKQKYSSRYISRVISEIELNTSLIEKLSQKNKIDNINNDALKDLLSFFNSSKLITFKIYSNRSRHLKKFLTKNPTTFKNNMLYV